MKETQSKEQMIDSLVGEWWELYDICCPPPIDPPPWYDVDAAIEERAKAYNCDVRMAAIEDELAQLCGSREKVGEVLFRPAEGK